MSDELTAPPPLQGCLYCHAEQSTFVVEGRRLFGMGNNYPVIRCDHCGSTALFDDGGDEPEKWRINYRRVNKGDAYFYVSIRLGKAGWLSARDALRISQDGYVQRKRVQQAHEGDLSWLQPAPINPPLPFMEEDESMFLALRAVSYQEASLPGLLFRLGPQTVLDSGKFYVTDRRLHLMGQRKAWSHSLAEVRRVAFNRRGWLVDIASAGQAHQYQGANLSDQFDSQLVAAVIRSLAGI
jgi:hypothetical protein